MNQYLQRTLRNENNVLLVAMLGLLHLVIIFGVENSWVHPLLLSHLGLFLMWQPLWRGEDKLGIRGAAFISLAFIVVILWLNWILLIFWMGSLLGLIGGRAFSSTSKWGKRLYLFAIFYVLLMLLGWVVPKALSLGGMDEFSQGLMTYFMPALLLFMVFMPNEPEQAHKERAVDFFYSLLLVTLVTILILGAIVIMTLGETSFQIALMELTFIIAGLLIFLSWMWNPRFGMLSLQQGFSHYLLNIGTPFEEWLTQLVLHTETEPDSAAFLAYAMHTLENLPWITGVTWQAPDGGGTIGNKSPHQLKLKAGNLDMQLWTGQPASPSMILHAHLLSQLIGHFHRTRQREVRMRQMAKMQAIHDTGARLTHDVKNLLQALTYWTTAAQQTGRDEDFRHLMQHQLPQLKGKLQHTLEKIKHPQSESSDNLTSADIWWQYLKGSFLNEGVTFQKQRVATNTRIPAELFNGVLENLLQNALIKRDSNPDISITVEFLATPNSIELNVCDSGGMVEDHIAQRLFQEDVSSRDGLGIGLYQSARWATQLNYELTLKKNEDGAVCFTLKSLQPDQ
ncbi:MAG: hypothetical protein R8M11_02855 [Gallionella sp.]